MPPGRLGASVAIGVSLGPEVADTKALPVADERDVNGRVRNSYN